MTEVRILDFSGVPLCFLLKKSFSLRISFCSFPCERIWNLMGEVTVIKDVALVKIYWSPAVSVDGILYHKPGGEGRVGLPL